MKTITDSRSAPTAQPVSESDGPATIRLVIRARILPHEPVGTQAPQRKNRRTLAAIAAAAVMIGIGVGIFMIGAPDSRPSPPASDAARSNDPPANRTEPPAAQPSAPPPQTAVHVPLQPIDEVLPNPSSSALQTIRGTVRVAVRVTIDRQGKVIAVAAEDPGPSRYFERLSVAAAKKWTFTPASSAEQRTMLLRFHFTRDGTTAHAARPR